jgi:predicted  nucleic acid-binding Zn-ribbon protein
MWKQSFSRLNEEYGLAMKKRQALGNLLEMGKISQTTHSLFTREIDDAVAEIESQRKALLEKMSSKAMELEGHIRTLEILLANFEIQHAVGEVDNDTYNRQMEILSGGLESAKKELSDVQDAVNQLSSDEVTVQQETEAVETQPSEPEVKLSEEPPQTMEQEDEPDQTVVQAVECRVESSSSDVEPEAEESQPT